MEEQKKITLKRKRKKAGGEKFFNRKRRFLLMFLLMLPFLIAIAIFSTIVFREGKALANLASGNQIVDIKPENIIGEGWYILRDNPTDLQKEYFAQLKDAMENEESEADGVAKAALVAQNYVADFYTWTNKQGQYDIGGMCYVYDGEFKNGDHYRENVYLNARQGFYKYLSTYATQYGKENLLEVTDVTVTKCEKMTQPYEISVHVENRQDANGEWYDYRENKTYDAYSVTCTWTYKDTTSLDLSKFANKINLAIIDHGDEFQIVEASEGVINSRKESDNSDETTKNEENEQTNYEEENGGSTEEF